MRVTVQKIYQPFKPTDDSSAFVGTDGSKYYLDIVSHRMLVEGMTIECEAQKRFPKDRSKPPYYQIQGGFNPIGAQSVPDPAPAQNGHAPPYQGPQQASYNPTPRPAGMVDRDVSITQQTLLKAFIGTGQFGLNDLPALEEACTASAKRLVKAAS